MESGKSWTVVQFSEDGTVEAVPSLWIEDDLCYWPSYTQPKMMSAIRRCEPLDKCWPTHRVKIFRNATFGRCTEIILNENFVWST